MKTIQDAAAGVVKTLQEYGYEAYLVGGCVRDLLMGRIPKDFDVTTNATPDEIEACFPRTIPLGKAFGVMVVLVPDEENTADYQIECATYRTDGDYTDGRRPNSVAFSADVREDVIRRDFTINGLLSVGTADASTVAVYEASMREANTRVTVGSETYGIIDLVGGVADLDNKIIRCIGDPLDRFADDALRMLRAVRFSAQLGFEIEEKTLEAIAEKAPTIKKVSKERIAAELFKLVAAPFPVKGLVPLVTTGLASFVLPFGFGGGYGGNFAMTLRRFTKFPTTNPLKGMAMLLAETDCETACNFCHELKLSNEQVEVIENALKLGGSLDMMSLAQLKRLARKPGIQINLDLFEQEVALGDGAMGKGFAEAIRKLRNFTPEDINPKPLVTGDDLIAMGLKPGPIFTKLLGALETEQLNGTMTTAATALRFVQELAAQEKSDA